MDSGKELTRHKNETVPTTALAFAWGISVQALNQKKVKYQSIRLFQPNARNEQTQGELFSTTTINDNNIAQHIQKGENVEVGVDGCGNNRW
jgi:hypothetical protein